MYSQACTKKQKCQLWLYWATSNHVSSGSVDVITAKPCQEFEICPLIQQFPICTSVSHT